LVIVLWRINFKSIPSMEENWCRHSCYSCLVAEKNRITKKFVWDWTLDIQSVVFI